MRAVLAHELRTAARVEVRKIYPGMEVARTYEGAAEAFAALETLLGQAEWFFGAAEPGVLDASVWAYTWLVGGGLESSDSAEEPEQRKDIERSGLRVLREALQRCPGLEGHRERVWRRYFADGEGYQ